MTNWQGEKVERAFVIPPLGRLCDVCLELLWLQGNQLGLLGLSGQLVCGAGVSRTK